MPKKNYHLNRSSNGEKPIHIEFTDSRASVVAIAGSFHGWRPEPVRLIGKGKWAKELMLPPGTYEYLFVADQRWLPDPLAKEAVPNPLSGVNSLLTVTE